MRRLILAALALAAGAALLQVANAEPEIRVAGTAAFAQEVDVPKVKPPPYWQTRGCDHGYRSKVSYQKVRRLMRHHQPHVRKKLVRRLAVCQFTRAKSRAVWRVVRESREWRQSYAHKWPIKFNSLPGGWQSWARAVSYCESHNYRYASNGTHHSYFQWAPSTWAAASSGWGAPASPYDASWHLQAVIAVAWAKRAGTSQWACSPW